MGSHIPHGLTHHIRNLVGLCRVVSQSDADLLTTFVESGDEESFTALVVRHGQTVWATCRRVLDNDADTEDAFQATFITLARKAATLRPEPLTGWLRKVAHEIALNAQKAARRRASAHRRLCEHVSSRAVASLPSDELRAAVQEELALLPERLRVPLALFYSDGKPQAEVAKLLGITDRAVRHRLVKGLAALRERLSSRGLAVTTATLLAVLGNVPIVSAVSPDLVTATALEVADGGPIETPAAQLSFQTTAGAAGRGWVKLCGLLVASVLTAGVYAVASSQPATPAEGPAAASPSVSQPQGSDRKDRFGDPLPPGALARVGTVRLRPGQSVGDTAVAIAPDGKTIYSVHNRNEVRVWDVSTGKEAQPFPGPRGCLGIALSPDGRRLVASGAQEVWAWDLGPNGPQLRWSQKLQGLACQSIAFSADGRTVACGGAAICLLDAITGECQRTLMGRGRKVVLSPDGQKLASGAGNEVSIWDIAGGEKRRTLICGSGKSSRVTSFAFSPDGRTLATATNNGGIRLWNAETGAGRRLTDDAFSNTFIAFEPEGRALVEFGRERIRFWNPETGKECRKAVEAPQLAANVEWDGCRLSADGKLFVSASSNAIGVWDVRSGRAVGPIEAPAGAVMSVAFSPDGRSLALAAMSGNGGWDGSAAPQVYDSQTGQIQREFRFPQVDKDRFVLFRPPVRFIDRQQLLISGVKQAEPNSTHGFCFTWGGTEPIAEPATGVKGRLNQCPISSPDGRLLVTPRPGGGVVVSERGAGKVLRTLETKSEVTHLSFAADNGLLVCWEYGRESAAVTVWDVRTGGRRGRWEVDPNPRLEFAPPLAVSSDGRRVAIGTDGRGMRGKVQVWDVASSTLLWDADGAANLAAAVAFSPDGRMLATGGDDGVVRLWEVYSGQVRLQLTGHRSRVWSAAFSPDGYRVASGSADTTALVWDVRPSLPAKVGIEPDALWTALIDPNPAVAYRAIFTLTNAPAAAIPLLRNRLKPAPAEPGQVRRWIVELGDNQFAVRERATKALAMRGDEVESALRAALRNNSSPEVQARLTRLIARLGPTSSTKLGVVRGVEALERMSTIPEARKLLEDLAEGPADSLLVQEARAARRRLAGPATTSAVP